MGTTHFLTKRLPKVAAEMALSVLGTKPLMACNRGLRPNRSWQLTDFPGIGVFTRPRTEANVPRALKLCFER